MAATVSLSISLDPLHRRRRRRLFSATHQTLPFTLFSKYPLSIPHKSDCSSVNFKSFTTACTTTTATTTGTTETTPTETSTSSFLEYPLRTGRFLSNSELEQLKFLENFRYHHELESGSMWVRVMRPEELDMVVGLLAESFAESMLMPTGYVSLLGYLVKQYLFEKMELLPHTATLIGFYRTRKQEGREEPQEEETEEEEEEEEEEEGVGEVEFLAGTVEVCFDKIGANVNPPTPTPPKDSPYISNMAVKKSLRRRGIGWHLLKASEELISQMSPAREVYLHCRMIDTAPFSMYQKAGYDIVKTDSILVLLLLQRRKHLMRKNLPVLTSFLESDTVFSEVELTS